MNPTISWRTQPSLPTTNHVFNLSFVNQSTNYLNITSPNHSKSQLKFTLYPMAQHHLLHSHPHHPSFATSALHCISRTTTSLSKQAYHHSSTNQYHNPTHIVPNGHYTILVPRQIRLSKITNPAACPTYPQRPNLSSRWVIRTTGRTTKLYYN